METYSKNTHLKVELLIAPVIDFKSIAFINSELHTRHGWSLVSSDSISLSKAELILLHTHWAHCYSTLTQRNALLFASFHSLTEGLGPVAQSVEQINTHAHIF